MSSKTPAPKRQRTVGPMGPFAYYVMKIIARMTKKGEDTYGYAIAKIAADTLPLLKRPAQVYVILSRLRGKGYLVRTLMETPRETGHTVEIHTITLAGKNAMEKAAEFYRLLQDDPEDEPKKK